MADARNNRYWVIILPLLTALTITPSAIASTKKPVTKDNEILVADIGHGRTHVETILETIKQKGYPPSWEIIANEWGHLNDYQFHNFGLGRILTWDDGTNGPVELKLIYTTMMEKGPAEIHFLLSKTNEGMTMVSFSVRPPQSAQPAANQTS